MCGDVTRRLDKEAGERVVDFRGLDGGEAKSHSRHGLDEALEECAQGRLTPGRRPGVRRAILPIGADMHPRQHDLRLMRGRGPRLVHEIRDGPRSVRPARQRRRAERAVLIAAVLDLEEGAMTYGRSTLRPDI